MTTDWQEHYKRRTISAEDAVNFIKSGDRVSFAYGREPLALGLALAARKEELKEVKIFVRTPSADFGWYDPGWQDSFQIEISFVLPIVRDMMAEHRCDFVPGSLMGITPHNAGVGNVDVLFIELSTPDDHGFCSFGASVWGKKKAIDCAKIVIAEVNKNLIRTYGDNYVHVTDIDYFVEHISSGRRAGGTDLLGRKTTGPGETEKRIAELVGSLIKEGDTLQIGVGSTSEWVASQGFLENKKDLGWHSETTPKGIIKLVRQGVITGIRKNINREKVVAVAVGGGTESDMKFVNQNPIFELYDAEYVLDPRVISANDNVFAVNSAVSIDLTGQISSESVGPSILSGPGGQLCFAIGAQLSKGGRFVTTLPSTAVDGKFSRIVPMLKEGTMTTVARTLADVVVTEYGIAQLRGKSHRERAMELISIAHPDFRSELKRKAEAMFWP